MSGSTIQVTYPVPINATIVSQGSFVRSGAEIVLNMKQTIPVIPAQITAGIPGPSEEQVAYSKRLDFISNTLFYKGEADPGALESAQVWRIRKVILGNDGDVTELWASGSANFNQAWSNRLNLNYS